MLLAGIARKTTRLFQEDKPYRQPITLKNLSIIALSVLLVSVSSAFVDSAYADDEDPIKMVLDITYENAIESREDIDELPENADAFFSAGEEKYFEALSA